MEELTKDTKFKPGQGGRPKGASNKITREQKERVEWVLEVLDINVEDDIKKMSPTERVKLWADLQEYVRPKLQRVNLDVGTDDKEIRKITFVVVGESEYESAQVDQEGNK